MATTSLFGPTPAELILAQQKEAQQEQLLRNQMIAQQGAEFGPFRGLYQAGLKFGDVAGQAAMQGMFPQQVDPRLQEATAVQSVLSKYQGQDLSSPDVLSNMSKEFTQLGRPQQAFMLAQEAAKREKEQKTETRAERALTIQEENARETRYKNNPELLIAEARDLPEDDPRKQTLINRYYQVKQEEQLKVQKTQAEIDRIRAETLVKLSERAGGPQEYNNNGIPMGKVDAKGNFFDNQGRKIASKEFVDAEQSHNTALDLLSSLRQIKEQDINSAYGSLADYTQSDTGKLIGARLASDTQKAQYKINQVGVKNVLENLQKLKGASTDKEMQKVASTFPGYQAKPEVMKAWMDDAIEATNRFLQRSEKRYGFDTTYEQENRFGTKNEKKRAPTSLEVPSTVTVRRIDEPK